MSSGANGTWIEKSSGIADLYYIILKYSNAPVLAIALIVLSVLALLLAIKWPKRTIYISYISLWLWLPLITSFLLSYKTGFFLDRYFYFVTPALYLLAASGIHMLLSTKHILKWSAYGLLSIGMLTGLSLHSGDMRYSGYHKDARPLALLMQNHLKQDNTAVIVTPAWFTKDLVYYFDFSLFTTYFGEYKEQAKFKIPLQKRNVYCTSAAIPAIEIEAYTSILIIDENQNNVYITSAIQKELEINFQQDTAYTIDTRRIFKYSKK
jgi:hypothetical protein